MKKVISILLVVAMLCCFMVFTVSADETTTVSGASVEGKTGDNVTMSISIGNNPGYRSYVIVLDYNAEALEVVSVNGNVTSNTRNPGKVIVSFASATKVEGNGEMFSVTFKVLGKCGTYPVSVTVDELYTDGTVAIANTASAGSVVVKHIWVKGETVAPTCTEQGYTVYTCSVCGITEKRDFVDGAHIPGKAVKENVVEATCTEAGSYDLVVYCSVCGEELSRESYVVTTDGHHYLVAYKDKTYHTWTCEYCGDAYDEKHTYTDHEDEYYWYCICGATKTKPVDDSYDHVPKTGDITSVITLGSAAVISLAGTSAFVFKRKSGK